MTELLLGTPGAGAHVPGSFGVQRAGSLADTRKAGLLLRLFREAANASGFARVLMGV